MFLCVADQRVCRSINSVRWWQLRKGLQRVRTNTLHVLPFRFPSLPFPKSPALITTIPRNIQANHIYPSNRVDKRSGQAVAIKIIDIESAEDEVEDIIQEIAILSELQSPYVTKYYGSYAKGAELWIVMEFCSGGSCADLMKPGKIEEEYIAIIVRELLLGLDYLHSDKKLHRDVKGNSTLYSPAGVYTLGG